MKMNSFIRTVIHENHVAARIAARPLPRSSHELHKKTLEFANYRWNATATAIMTPLKRG